MNYYRDDTYGAPGGRTRYSSDSISDNSESGTAPMTFDKKIVNEDINNCIRDTGNKSILGAADTS